MSAPSRSIREQVEMIGIDEQPGACLFVIAMALRSAIQGDVSTYDGECATICRAMKLLGIREPTALARAWLDDLGTAADMRLPGRFWEKLADAGLNDLANEEDFEREMSQRGSTSS